jgi:hypothetical protein
MKHVLTFLALMVFQYLLVAFTCWNINSAEWSESIRFGYASLSTSLSVLITLLSEEKHPNEK